MAYHYENIRLEKGMYGRSGTSFAQTLEELDPSEHYKGTSLEGMDAFQRQLKRFDIRVKGAGSDCVEKFFHTTESAVLFPEFVSRVVRQGLEEGSILPDITATVTRFDGMDYRSIASRWTGRHLPLWRRSWTSRSCWRCARATPSRRPAVSPPCPSWARRPPRSGKMKLYFSSEDDRRKEKQHESFV